MNTATHSDISFVSSAVGIAGHFRQAGRGPCPVTGPQGSRVGNPGKGGKKAPRWLIHRGGGPRGGTLFARPFWIPGKEGNFLLFNGFLPPLCWQGAPLEKTAPQPIGAICATAVSHTRGLQ